MNKIIYESLRVQIHVYSFCMKDISTQELKWTSQVNECLCWHTCKTGVDLGFSNGGGANFVRTVRARRALLQIKFKVFRWEPGGRYCHWLCTAIAPFWFSTEHLWAAITPFWLSTDDIRSTKWLMAGVQGRLTLSCYLNLLLVMNSDKKTGTKKKAKKGGKKEERKKKKKKKKKKTGEKTVRKLGGGGGGGGCLLHPYLDPPLTCCSLYKTSKLWIAK